MLQGSDFSYNDYPLSKREGLHNLFLQFMEKKLSYEDLCKKIETISIEFLVDYSLDDPDAKLGALSPFIIDVDVDTTTALICVEYQLKTDENKLRELFKDSCYSEGQFDPNAEEMHDVLVRNFTKLFGLTIYAVNPKNLEDRQVKSRRELEDLFPYYPIPAERILGEDGTQTNESLSSLISEYFSFIIAGENPAKPLELLEKALNQMPLSVGMPIYRPGITDIALWRDCIGGLLRNNVLSDRLCSVRLISKDIASLNVDLPLSGLFWLIWLEQKISIPIVNILNQNNSITAPVDCP